MILNNSTCSLVKHTLITDKWSPLIDIDGHFDNSQSQFGSGKVCKMIFVKRKLFRSSTKTVGL